MQKKFFLIALNAAGNPSGSINSQITAYHNRGDAEKSAASILAKNNTVASVHVVSSVAVCERQQSPMKITEIVEDIGTIEGTEASIGPGFKDDNTRMNGIDHHQV